MPTTSRFPLRPLTTLGMVAACLLMANHARAQAGTRGPSGPAAARPNILVIIADDLGWNGVGYHQAAAPTPNLNRLATEGTTVERFYTYPVCSPSRAAFLTGKLPRRFGIVDPLAPRQAGLPDGTPTLPGMLRAAGYQTSLIGKWHLGRANPPMSCGFDHFYGFLGAEIDYFKHTNQRGDRDWQRDGKDLDEPGYSTSLLADETIRQLKQRDAKRPFFIQVAFNAPHVPLAAPDELVAKHAKDGGLYAAVIDAMDSGIGRILAALDANGLRDNTLVVFFSDNGGGRRFTDNTPLRNGKDTINEGGIRTPCVIRWPGTIPAGVQSRQPIAVHDFLPTLAAAARLTDPVAAESDGSNQWAALTSGKILPRPPIVIASRDTAVIDGNWKWITSEAGQQFLYDLGSDIGEAHDQSAARPDLVAKLAAIKTTVTGKLPPIPARRGPPGAPTR